MAKHKDFIITAEVRTDKGKNDSRRLRVAGKVPLTIYGGGEPAVSVAAPLAQLAAVLRSESGANTIFNIDFDGKSTEVMFVDRQIDPLKSRLIHADLKRIVRGEKLEITIPLHLEGIPFGVKTEGGVLDQVAHEIQVRCSPRDIPEAIHADVTELKASEVLHVKDIKIDDKLEVLSDPETVVAIIKIISQADLDESLISQVEPIASEANDAGMDPQTDDAEQSSESKKTDSDKK